MLRWAVRHGDLDHNPVEAMKKPAAANPRTRVLTPQEMLWEGLPTALARSKTCQRIIQAVPGHRPAGRRSRRNGCERVGPGARYLAPPRAAREEPARAHRAAVEPRDLNHSGGIGGCRQAAEIRLSVWG